MATTIASIDTQHTDMVHDAQLDFYGRRLATCSSDRCIKVYDVLGDEHAHTADLLVHEGPVWQVAWAHPQFGTLLASCGYDRRVVIQREVSPGHWVKIYSYEDHASSVNSVAWAPREYGLQLAAASSDGKLSVLSHRGDDSWSSVTMTDAPLGVNAVSWAPASHIGGRQRSQEGQAPGFVRRLAAAGCDGKVRVYRCSGGDGWELEASLSAHKDWCRDVAWSPGSGLSVNMMASCSDDGTVVIWRQAAAGGEWAGEPLPLFGAPVWRVSFSVTGNLLAVSCGDNSVTLWKESLGGQWQQVSTVPDPTQAVVGGQRQQQQQQGGY